MAFGSEALLNKIVLVKITDWPGGWEFRLVELIKEKCAPKDRMAGVERTRKLNQVELKVGEDPAKLFEQVKAIDNQFSELTHGLTKDDKIGIILEKGAEEYGVILANTARDKGSRLTMDDLEEAMIVQWRIVSTHTGSPGGKKKEFSLVSFSGKCYHCGQSGHKANNCPNKPSSERGGQQSGGQRRFTGKCNICGKEGIRLPSAGTTRKMQVEDRNGGIKEVRPLWRQPTAAEKTRNFC